MMIPPGATDRVLVERRGGNCGFCRTDHVITCFAWLAADNAGRLIADIFAQQPFSASVLFLDIALVYAEWSRIIVC